MKLNNRRAGFSLVRSGRPFAAVLVLFVFLSLAVPRRSRAEDRIDFKYMYYQEDDDRIRVLTPSVLLESELSDTLTLRVEGIYNAISGASPTGAPPPANTSSTTATQPYSVYVEEARDNEESGRAEEEFEGDDDDDEGEDREEFGDRGRGRALNRARAFRQGSYHARAGATPQPSPSPAPSPAPAPRTTTTSSGTPAPAPSPAPAPAALPSVPLADATDERTAFNIGLDKRLEDHLLGGQVSYSTENDYESLGLALRDSIDFNKKNTTLNLGTAYTHDQVDAFARGTTEDKDTIDILAGVTQVLSPTTLFAVNLTLSQVEGFLDDQYKVVELNGVLIPEKRPDNKDKTIVYLALTQFFKSLDGSAELSYRFYDDTFGIVANTYELAWYQKFGRHFIVRPMVRLYEQGAADFYDVRFTGSPTYYSSDYRVSEFEALGYGLKVIWKPRPGFAIDVAAERYEQDGKDGVTSQEAYPAATIFTAGARIWF